LKTWTREALAKLTANRLLARAAHHCALKRRLLLSRDREEAVLLECAFNFGYYGDAP